MLFYYLNGIVYFGGLNVVMELEDWFEWLFYFSFSMLVMKYDVVIVLSLIIVVLIIFY